MKPVKKYEDLNGLELDTIREIGSIGTGNAATALSSMLGCTVRLQMPEVRIMGYNEAIDWIGGPEVITAGVLVQMSGEVNGIMLSVQQMEFVNLVLKKMVDHTVESYEQLSDLDRSALVEVGNIMISTFINALSSLAGITTRLTVPAFAVDMQGAILTVPMVEFGGQSDYIMTIGANFICDDKAVPCRLLLSPDILSLNFLLKKLGQTGGWNRGYEDDPSGWYADHLRAGFLYRNLSVRSGNPPGGAGPYHASVEYGGGPKISYEIRGYRHQRDAAPDGKAGRSPIPDRGQNRRRRAHV